jgi:hypothetical protein
VSRQALAALAIAGLLAACRLDLTGATCHDDSNCPVRQYCARAISEPQGVCRTGVGPPEISVDFTVGADRRLIPLGGTAQAYAIAVVLDGGLVVPDGGVVTDLVDWETDPTGIISVANDDGSPKGAIVALAPGTTTLKAFIVIDHVPLSAEAPFVVSSAELLDVLVVTDRPSYAANTGGAAAATGFFTDGTHADLTSLVQWSSSAPGVMSVSNASGTWGRLAALAPGEARLQASYQKLEGDAGVEVTAATLVALSISPVHPRASASTVLQLEATGLFSDGTVQSMTRSVGWSFDTPAVGYFGPGTPGSLTLLSAGTGTIQALAGNILAAAQLEVGNAVPAQLEIDPVWLDPLGVGTTAQLVAWSTDSAGVVGSPPVVWHSADPGIDLSPSGTLEAIDAGLGVLMADSDPVDATAQVEVTSAPSVSLLIWPPGGTVPLGTSGQLALERTYADGTVQDLGTAAGWRPAPADAGPPVTAMADVDTGDHGGTVRMRGPGIAAVQAVLPGKRALATVVAPSGPPTSLEVIPDAVALSSAARTHLAAVAHWADGTVADVTAAASWTSDAPTLAVTGNGPAAGTVLGLGVGAARIRASFQGANAASQLSLEPGPASAEAWPPAQALALGTAVPLTATLLSPSGDASDVTADVTWVSSVPTIAYVTNAPDQPRTVVGRSAGTATLLGKVDGWTAQASARVTTATLSGLQLVPPTALLRWWPAAFQALGQFSDGSVQDLTTQVSWSSSSPVRMRIRGTGLDRGQSQVLPGATGTVDVSARPRGGPASTAEGLPIDSTQLLTVEVVGAGSLAAGTEGRLQALGHGADGTTVDVTGLASWFSANPAVAVVSSRIRPGRVRALQPGSLVVSAQLQGISGGTTLSVSGQAITGLAAEAPSTLSAGTFSRASATITLAGGGTQTVSENVVWSSDSPDVLSVSNAPGGRGRLAAIAPGTATVRAQSRIPGASGFQATTVVTVGPAQILRGPSTSAAR